MITAAILICLAPTAIDGDTVRCGTSPARIRVFGVQAPEIGQSGAIIAKTELQKLIIGGITCEPKGANYNRIVAICTNSKGEDIGRVLLEAGRATEWCSYSRNYYGRCPL